MEKNNVLFAAKFFEIFSRGRKVPSRPAVKKRNFIKNVDFINHATRYTTQKTYFEL